MKGGAWPFLVGGVNCLVNSVNERDLILLNSPSKRFGVFGVAGLAFWGNFFVLSFSRLLLPPECRLLDFLTS